MGLVAVLAACGAQEVSSDATGTGGDTTSASTSSTGNGPGVTAFASGGASGGTNVAASSAGASGFSAAAVAGTTASTVGSTAAASSMGNSSGVSSAGAASSTGGVASGGSTSGVSASSGGSSGAVGPWSPLSVGMTDGTLQEPFDVQISGQGEAPLGSLSITDDVGTLEISGVTYPVIAYEQIPYSAAGDTLYQLLGVGPTELLVAWAYCNAGALNEIWYETTAGIPVTYAFASGTCTAAPTSESLSVQLPAFEVSSIDVVQGFSMESSQLGFDGSDAGVMDLGGDDYLVYPFNTVDCSTGCGTPGWYELHSLLWNPSTQQACFGIYYLFVESPEPSVPLDYVLCLPGLGDPTNGGTSFAAAYAYPDGG